MKNANVCSIINAMNTTKHVRKLSAVGAYGKIKSSRDTLSANTAGKRQAPLD